MFLKKNPPHTWQILFLFVLDSYSALDEKTLQRMSPTALAMALYITYCFEKSKIMQKTYGDIYWSGDPNQYNPAVQFLIDIFLFDFLTLYSFFHSPCCSPWKLGLRKEAKKIIKKMTAHNTALRTDWELFAERVRINTLTYQRRTNKTNTPE